MNDAAKELVAGDDFTELRSSDSSDDDYDYDDDADEQASVAESNAHASVSQIRATGNEITDLT